MTFTPPTSLKLQSFSRPLNSLIKNNRILNSLTKSGRINDARNLFDEMPQRDEISYNTLISSYSRSGLFPLALSLFRRMLASGLPVDPFSLGAILRNCPSLTLGLLAHSLAAKSSLDADPFTVAAFITMYSKFGEFNIAFIVFSSVPIELTNRVLWTSVIAAHVQNGDFLNGMNCFRIMRGEGIFPNQFTLPSVFCACGYQIDLFFGRQIHSLVIRIGFDSNVFVQSSIVCFYGKCGDFIDAEIVLEFSEFNDPVSWNSLIVICSRSAFYEHALYLFVKMRQRDIELDDYTYPSALNSVAAGGDFCNGSALHCLVLKTGFAHYRHVCNAVVDMYAKCGRPEIAFEVFDGLPQKDVVGWTALFNGFARHVSDESALRLYCLMRAESVEPDEFLLSGVLSSCGELTLLESGRQVHALAMQLSLNLFRSVGNALVTMYAKCGCVDEAHLVFDSMSKRDAITWTAMIVGFAQNGRGRDSIPLFDRMVRDGAHPDYVTFIGLLFACSHTGLVEVGRAHFESMGSVYGVAPGPEHYACMVDLFGRVGRVMEAVELLGRAGQSIDTTVWKALLAACRVHCNVGVAEWAAKELLRLDPSDAATYVMLSNVYSRAGRWMEVARVRRMMRAHGANKEPGCSWVENEGQVHVFHVEDRGNPSALEIYDKVDEMLERVRAEGYVVDTKWSLQDATEEEREQGLAYHSEKLAVAFGLMVSPKSKPLRIYKNLRICGDCHNAIKLVAMVYERVIILRDANCFHHFSGGNCSCSDYW